MEKFIKLFWTLGILFTLNITNAAPVQYLQITGGSHCNTLLNSCAFTDFIAPGNYSTLTIGGYDGSAVNPGNNTLDDAKPYYVAVAHQGVYGPIGLFTAESDGVNSGYAPVTGDITDNTLSLDLSSWTQTMLIVAGDDLSYVTVNLGSSSDMIANSFCHPDSTGTASCTTPIETTYDPASGEFTASWSAVHYRGILEGGISNFEITGLVSTVPLPAAAWLFGCGLVGLTGLARKKTRV